MNAFNRSLVLILCEELGLAASLIFVLVAVAEYALPGLIYPYISTNYLLILVLACAIVRLFLVSKNHKI